MRKQKYRQKLCLNHYLILNSDFYSSASVTKTTPEQNDFKWGDICSASPFQSLRSAIILLFLGLLWGRMPWWCRTIKQGLLTSQQPGRTKRKGEIGDPLCSSRTQPHPMMLLHFTVNLLLNASATSHLPMTPRGGIQVAKAWGSKEYVQIQTILMMYRNPVLMRFIIIHSKVK